jgi:uncharacterized protein with PhoU and TrkA domain
VNRIEVLEVDMDCLDRAAIGNGVTAAEALARTKALETVLHVALDDDAPEPAGTLSDLVYVKMAERRRKAEARRRRIAETGFRLVQGGAS